MRNEHKFTAGVDVRCPFDNCGKSFLKDVTVKYVTNQKGDVIEKSIS